VPRSSRSIERRVLDLVGDAYSFDGLDEFRSGVLPLVKEAVPATFAAYNEVDEDPANIWGVVDPILPAYRMEAFIRNAEDNPILAHNRRTLDGRPRRISDFITTEELHATRLYQECYGPIGVESQVAFTLPSRPPVVIAIALSRGAEDFGDDEVQLLGLARPHLIQAYRAAELSAARDAALATLEAGLDTVASPLVVVDRHGRITFATQAARRVLAERLGTPRPDRLAAPLRERLAAREGRDPVVVDDARGSGTVTLRVLDGPRGSDTTMVLLDATGGPMTVDALRGLGLTSREAEALRWVALGQTGPAAARLMAISPRTFDKHLQHVYGKLGVRTRSEAAATAWAAIDVHEPR
jgi:DNA-binding CsgD family transcriptional regulator/PAS domain-containing protein